MQRLISAICAGVILGTRLVLAFAGIKRVGLALPRRS